MEGSNILSPFDEMKFRKLLKGDEAIKGRLAGYQVVLEIRGHPFYVDTHRGKLRPKDLLFHPGIDVWNEGNYNAFTNSILFCYHFPSKSVAKISPDIWRLPVDVIVIKVPALEVLDPIGVARMEGRELDHYTRIYPVKLYHVAETFPLTRNNLYEITKIDIPRQYMRKKNKARIIKKGKYGGKRHN